MRHIEYTCPMIVKNITAVGTAHSYLASFAGERTSADSFPAPAAVHKSIKSTEKVKYSINRHPDIDDVV